MRGTSKQVKWAEEIRKDMIEKAPEFEEALLRINDAQWFINNRRPASGLSMLTWVGILVGSYYNGIRVADTPGFEALEGTPKQIKWAADIRQNLVDKAIKEKFTALALRKDEKAVEKKFAIVIEGLKAQTSAKWFIENRDVCDLFEMFEQAHR